VAGTAAQFATYSQGDYSLSVNVPSDTASSKNGAIYLQISAPSDIAWFGVGQGSRMAGSNMFIVYSASDSNVTVSPRLGTNHAMPQYNSDAQISVLEGSGIVDGKLVANVRCDNCLSWSGGSMDPTDSESSWIMAYKSGSALDSTDVSERISQHSADTGFSLDLTSGTGGSSSNPFVSAASTDEPTSTDEPASSAVASGGATATSAESTGSQPSSTDGVSVPVSNSDPSSGGSQSSGASTHDASRKAHAVIMSLVFLVLFPLFALTIYLPFTKKVLFLHAPLQISSIILLLVGLGTGVYLAKNLDELDAYHQVIGYIIVACLVLLQPVMGLIQHLHFRKTGGRSLFGSFHRWLGRVMIALGIINGGLGLHQSGPVGSKNVPRGAVIVYSIVAAVVFCIYLAVVISSQLKASRRTGAITQREKMRGDHEGYEMHSSS